MKKTGWRELDAKANEALTRFYDRTGWSPVDSRMPFAETMERERKIDQLEAGHNQAPVSFPEYVAAEDDGQDCDIGEYELTQRMVGIKAFFRFLKARGVHPAAMLKQLAAAGRACHIEPFHAMTMGEIGLMFGETKAAHSWRCKILSKEIELAGMHGSKLPGQKSKEASNSYHDTRMGNTNRRGGKKKPRAVQKSFLRKLHVTAKSTKI